MFANLKKLDALPMLRISRCVRLICVGTLPACGDGQSGNDEDRKVVAASRHSVAGTDYRTVGGMEQRPRRIDCVIGIIPTRVHCGRFGTKIRSCGDAICH